MRGSFCVHSDVVRFFKPTTQPPVPDDVIYHCPGHSIRDSETNALIAPPFGTLMVTADELIYVLRDERHAWPLADVEGFRSEVAPGTTTARLGGGPVVLVSVRHPDALPKLQQAVRVAQLAQS